MTDLRADVMVIGCGAAGVAAARAASEAGATALVVSGPPGATGLCSGALRGAPSAAFLRLAAASGAAAGLFRVGGRFVSSAGWVITDAVGALSSLLDLSTLPTERPVGVLHMDTHPSWSPWLLANTLGARVVRVNNLPSAPSFCELAMSLDTEGIAEGLGESLRAACAGLSGLLMPPVLGLRRDDVAERISRVCGVTVGEVAALPGDPPGIRLERALRRWLPDSVVLTGGVAKVRAAERPEVSVTGVGVVTVTAVVLATGGLASGGIVFENGLREATANGTLWVRGRERVAEVAGSERGFDPMEWFDDASHRALNAGLRTDHLQRVLGPEAEGHWRAWLFAAGDVAPWGHGEGLAGALSSGARAGAEAARFALG